MVLYSDKSPVTDDGSAVQVAIVSGGGGGGGGDMTETNTRIGTLTETAPATDTASSGLNGRVQRIAQRITSLIALLPTSLGAKTAANSFAVTLATDGAAVTQLTLIAAARTPTTTNVSSSATSVTVLASNASRRGVSFWNNSTAILYLSASGTATVANAMFAIPPQGLLILDQQLIFTGAITGIWSAANGSVNVTEFV